MNKRTYTSAIQQVEISCPHLTKMDGAVRCRIENVDTQERTYGRRARRRMNLTAFFQLHKNPQQMHACNVYMHTM